jgi:hypothetical protein
VAAEAYQKSTRVNVEIHPLDMHPIAASYAPRLQKLAIQKHQISVQGDVIALWNKSIYVS